MKKITRHCKVDAKNYIFTEGINYFKTPKTSIWGKGDKKTLEIIDQEDICGNWLHLAAGDGRYNLKLLKKTDSIVAADIDESALSKLWHNTPKKYQPKLKIMQLNLTKKFPFKDKAFDGIFCTGTLHLFPRRLLIKIFKEVNRVLKPEGKVIIDFATDAKRIKISDGKPYIIKTRANYTSYEAKEFLKKIFKDYKMRMYQSEVFEEFQGAHPAYKLHCKFWIIVAIKK
jgi:ubiquinone/menaquinone biosynthesis C-methylase UbiE